MDLEAKYPLADSGLLWQFRSLLMGLIALSVEAKLQQKVETGGDAPQELVQEFRSRYSEIYHMYLEAEIFDEEQNEVLLELNDFLDERWDNWEDEFWNVLVLGEHEDWKKVRKMAKNCLDVLGFGQYTLKLERSTEYFTTASGMRASMTRTELNLVEKDPENPDEHKF
ncbi:MAG: hypothetical protein AAGD28_18840 [Bacteroidota bacterium]